MEDKKKWYDDEKNLGTSYMFNLLWFGFWTIGLIFGTKGVALELGWESYAVGLFSILMLFTQMYHLLEILNVHNERRSSDTGGTKE